MRMMMKAAKASFVAALMTGLAACSGGSGDAQDVVVVGQAAGAVKPSGIPTIKDLPPGYNMAGGEALDMRGISLGMPRAEALAKLGEYFPGGKTLDTSTGLNGYDGINRASFPFDAEDEMTSTVDGTRDMMRVTYTSPLSGERVMGVARSLSYDGQQPSFDEVLNGVIAKYGTPTYRLDQDTVVKLSYVWFEGKLAPPTTQQALSEMEAGSLYQKPPADPDWCISTRGMNEFTYNLVYSDDEIIDRAPGCTVVLTVRLAQGARPDLLYLADFNLMDYRRSFDNRVLNSTWLKDEIAKVAAQQGGAAAPSL